MLKNKTQKALDYQERQIRESKELWSKLHKAADEENLLEYYTQYVKSMECVTDRANGFMSKERETILKMARLTLKKLEELQNG